MTYGYQPYACKTHRNRNCQCRVPEPGAPVRHPEEPSQWRLIEEPYRVAVENDENIIAEIYLSDETHEDSDNERQAALTICKLVRAAPQLLMALEDAIAILQPLAEQLPSVKSRCEGYARIVRLAREG